MLSCSCCRPAGQLQHARSDRKPNTAALPSSACHSASSSAPIVEAAQSHVQIARRQLLLQSAATLITAGVSEHWAPRPVRALPLAPLGESKRVGGDKLVGLTPEQVRDVLAKDLSEGMYFVTGNLTREIFADDCRFSDPTNDVTGLSKYVTALGILFDPDWSKVVLLNIQVTGPRTIEADWKLGGWLRTQYFPWQPKVEPFTGHTVYTLNDAGLIQHQQQTWSISGFKALQETFTPALGPRVQLL